MKFDRSLIRKFARDSVWTFMAFLAVACSSERAPEDAVRETLASIEAAAEARDVSALMEFVAEDFASDAGSRRADLRNMVRGYFVAHPSLELVVRVDSIEFPVDELARVQLRVASVAKRDASVTGLDVDFEAFRIEMVHDGTNWLVRRLDRGAAP